ncbi:MAG: aspartate--tRNA ligase [Myxococcales bacterium]|nr:aspartate--tRNA ligase [Myxococcales bacterium]MCB9645837.1 aspartate--tRNA ligase [Deltaproteobacteria bacterium]
MSTLKRTHMCGALREAHVGQDVVLMGWVQSNRRKGGVTFLVLRDRAGIVQVTLEENDDPAVFAAMDPLRPEWVVAVVGKVRSRGKDANPDLPTGAVEVVPTRVEVLNQARTPPFEVRDDVDTGEDKRLAHRFIDLRRPAIQRNLMMRSKMSSVARQTLVRHGFLELETPYLVKYTPGGARNFLVPCRLTPGTFYALAESPQIFKQLFMVSGFDRYFQIVKCFRDEDLRQDRQPEFTQIDLELSFADEDDVQQVMEDVVGSIFREVLGVELPERFPKMTYEEAMRRFGSDKPDLRFGMEHVGLNDLVAAHDGGGVAFFKQTLDEGGLIKAMRLPAEYALSRSDLDKLEKDVKAMGAGGLGRAKVGEDGAWSQSPFAKTISDALREAVNQACGAQPGDLLLFQMGKAKVVHTVMSHLRLTLGRKFEMIPEGAWKVLWVTEFPLFEHDEENGRYVAAHHPFTSPRAEDVDRLTSDPGACRARAYDLVLNGNEVAGGSVRIHDSAVQAKVFDALGISESEKQAKFGFLLDALSYGAPPHAGIAAGMDRLAMLVCGAQSLRDVIPFPKTQKGLDLMTGAPTAIDAGQLAEVYVASIEKPES